MKLSGNDCYMIAMSILDIFENFSHFRPFLLKMAEKWLILKIHDRMIGFR